MPTFPVEYLASWHDGPYRLHLFTSHETDEFGHTALSYQFRHNGDIVFDGGDYRPGSGIALDGADSVSGLLGFLTLRPGDTDWEYFAAYSPCELLWAIEHAEELSAYIGEDSDDSERDSGATLIALGMCDMSDLPEVADYLARVPA